MSSNETQQILGQLRRTFGNRKRLIVLCAILALGPVVAFNETQTPIYEAATTLVFDELAGPAQTFNTSSTRETRMSNRVQELGSRAFATEVVATLDEDDRSRFGEPDEGESDYERWLARQVNHAILPMAVKNTSLIRLFVHLGDPELAATVANRAAEVYATRNLRIRQEGVHGIRRFVEEQLERFETQLDQSEEALRDYKRESHMSTFESHETEILHRLTEAEVLYNAATTERSSQLRKLASIEENLTQTRADLVPSVTAAATPWMKKLQDRLVELQLQYADLQVQNYPADHPTMVQLERDIKQTRDNLTAEAERVASSENMVDPIGQMERYGAERLEVQIKIEELGARETALKRVIDQYEGRLATLPEKELQLAKLTRERDVNQKIYNNLLEKLEETKISEAENLPTVRIVDQARANHDPIRPRKKVNLLLGLMVGLIGGTAIAFVKESGTATISSVAELEELTGWPALASVPQVAKIPSESFGVAAEKDATSKQLRSLKRSHISLLQPGGAPAEAYRMLRTNLKFRGVGSELRTVVITSAAPNDGKSTLVSNLAIAFASMGQRVLVIDGEVRRAGMHTVFDVPLQPGLRELIDGHHETDDGRPDPRDVERLLAFAKIERSSRLHSTPAGESLPANPVPLDGSIHTTKIDHLSVMPGGAPVGNPQDAIAAHVPALRRILSEARTRYDVVLIDTPPLAIVHDVAILASIADGVIFVANAQHYDRELLLKGRQILERAGAHVIGAVLNQIDADGVYRKNAYYYTDDTKGQS
jgi:polysaccharide biosynthesis transport protein